MLGIVVGWRTRRSSFTQRLVRQRIHILRHFLGLSIFHIFYVMVNSDLEVASCPALQCHGDVCTVDAPVTRLSGSTLKYGHYVHEPFASDSQMFAVRASVVGALYTGIACGGMNKHVVVTLCPHHHHHHHHSPRWVRLFVLLGHFWADFKSKLLTFEFSCVKSWFFCWLGSSLYDLKSN